MLKSMEPLGKIEKSSKDKILSQNNIRFRTKEFVAESILLCARAESPKCSETKIFEIWFYHSKTEIPI